MSAKKVAESVYNVGLIGFGKMGTRWAQRFVADRRWSLARVCDRDKGRRVEAAMLAPNVRVGDDPDAVFGDPAIDAVGLFTLADDRPDLIRGVLAAGKHVIAEKPIAHEAAAEEAPLSEIEASDRLVAVNLFNRNAWYHHRILDFIGAGQIGDLGIVRVCHMTPGRMPGEDHLPEGPVFHDCGMHYVDVARWYARSEYDRWHAQGVRLWSEDEPWWITVHGRFENGVVFEITVGFVYGQVSRDWINHSALEAIGTRGVARCEHDFKDVHLRMHGVDETIDTTGPYGGKKLDEMLDLFARSLDAGRNLGLPTVRDSVIASRVAQQMHDDANADAPPCVGDAAELKFVTDNKRQSPSR